VAGPDFAVDDVGLLLQPAIDTASVAATKATTV
jgi:hypothetical protein